MTYVFRRGEAERSYQVRPDATGEGFEIEVMDAGDVRIERFDTLDALLLWERSVVRAWLLQGWMEAAVANLNERK
jgi:hypothetical protein